MNYCLVDCGSEKCDICTYVGKEWTIGILSKLSIIKITGIWPNPGGLDNQDCGYVYWYGVMENAIKQGTLDAINKVD